MTTPPLPQPQLDRAPITLSILFLTLTSLAGFMNMKLVSRSFESRYTLLAREGSK